MKLVSGSCALQSQRDSHNLGIGSANCYNGIRPIGLAKVLAQLTILEDNAIRRCIHMVKCSLQILHPDLNPPQSPCD